MSEFKARIETATTEYLVLDDADLVALAEAMREANVSTDAAALIEALEVKIQRLARRLSKVEERQGVTRRGETRG